MPTISPERELKLTPNEKNVPTVVDLNGLEVFAPGMPNGKPYPPERIARMISETKKFMAATGNKPYGKLTHKKPNEVSDKDKSLVIDSMAIGQVSDLYFNENNKLSVDMTNMPTNMARMVKAGLYKRSVEIYPEYTIDGQTFGPILKAVAFDGQFIPAVSNLDDAAVAMFSKFSTDPQNDFPFDTINFDNEEMDMDDAAMIAALTIISKMEPDKIQSAVMDLLSQLTAMRETSDDTPDINDPMETNMENNATTPPANPPASTPPAQDEKDKKIAELTAANAALQKQCDEMKAKMDSMTAATEKMANEKKAEDDKKKAESYSNFKKTLVEEKRYLPAELEKFEADKALSVENFESVKPLFNREKDFVVTHKELFENVQNVQTYGNNAVGGTDHEQIKKIAETKKIPYEKAYDEFYNKKR